MLPAVIAIASVLAQVPAPRVAFDERCREPTQWRRGTPRRHCAFTLLPDWPKRERALGELRIANWTLITGASIFVIGTAMLIGGIAGNKRAPNGRGDEPTFILAGGATMGLGGLLAIIGGAWRIGLGARHQWVRESVALRR